MDGAIDIGIVTEVKVRRGLGFEFALVGVSDGIGPNTIVGNGHEVVEGIADANASQAKADDFAVFSANFDAIAHLVRNFE